MRFVKREVKRETWEKKGKENLSPLEKRAEVPGGWWWAGRLWRWAGFVWRGRGSQRAVSCLVFGQNVLTAAEFLPQVGHFLSERPVLFLQESRADGDLVLFQPASVPGAFGCVVVLSASCPVSVVLCGDGEREKQTKNKLFHLEFPLVTKFH